MEVFREGSTRGVNKFIRIGNASRDAELGRTQSDKVVSNIRLTTNRLANGQETTSTYVNKGEPLYVEGRLEYRTYQDGDGIERGVGWESTSTRVRQAL